MFVLHNTNNRLRRQAFQSDGQYPNNTPADDKQFPKQAFQYLGLLLALSSVAACSGTIHRTSQLGGISVLSLDARQRIIVSGVRIEVVDGVEVQRTVVCAEPSPDTIVAQASYLAGKANVDGKAAAQIAAGLNESAGSIGVRTQSIQLLRDGYYRFCEAYLNGVIGEEEYAGIIDQIDRFMIALIAIEAVTGVTVAPAISIGSGGKVTFSNDGAGLTGESTVTSAVLKEIKAKTKTLSKEQVEAVAAIVKEYMADRRNSDVLRAKVKIAQANARRSRQLNP